MELAMVGLGKMGFNMTTRLIQGGHRVVGFAHSPKSIQAAVDVGAVGAETLQEAVNKLPSPRVVWLMIPAGNPTFETIDFLTKMLAKGDVVIDGGNSYYKDSIRHAEMLTEKGIEFVDCGTSGGIWGLRTFHSASVRSLG